jgi:uncharacterized protein YqfA (UPF0365 family)
MNDAILVALITGGCSILGVVITNIASNKKIETQLVTAQAVTDQKIEQLTNEVRRHNSFGDRITRLEEVTRQLTDRVERMDGRISRYHEEHG